MQALTIRVALGGPWASHWLVWLALYPPTTLLVLLREGNTPYPEPWWPLASATIQHLVVGVIVLGGGELARRWHPILPLSIVMSLWAAAATSRALIGGALAEGLAGVDPEFTFRIAAWVTSSVVWVPMFVYAIAQVDRRRLLLAALDVAEEELKREELLALESTEQLHARLASTVRAQVEPVLHDLEHSLETQRSQLSGAMAAEIGMRLSQLHDDTATLVERDGPIEEAPPPRSRASYLRAINVRTTRPVLVAGVVSVATLLLIVPDVTRTFGSVAGLEVAIGTMVTGIMLATLPFVATPLHNARQAPAHLLVSSLVTVAAIGAGAATMSLLGSLTVESSSVVLVPLVGLTILFAESTVIGGIVVGTENDDDDARLTLVTTRSARLQATRLERGRRERERMAQLMHGPIQGRLAACVMALNFHASTAETDPAGAQQIMESVLDHLQAVSRELIALTESPGSPP